MEYNQLYGLAYPALRMDEFKVGDIPADENGERHITFCYEYTDFNFVVETTEEEGEITHTITPKTDKKEK
ncbi:MAG: hypothetical protein LBK56_14225 [Gracilibacteraceae bacterium]|jgi:hypothetical protein|nr:hypothetical protein [Gracilibacteraceae bacterium]